MGELEPNYEDLSQSVKHNNSACMELMLRLFNATDGATQITSWALFDAA